MNEQELQGYLSRIPYAKSLGVIPKIEGDEFTLILPFHENNIGNPFLPALHGGIIGGFMEIAAISQVMLLSKTRSFPKTIGINVDYLRPGQPKDLFARAKIARQGSRVANVRVNAWHDDIESPIAALHGHFLTLEPKDE